MYVRTNQWGCRTKGRISLLIVLDQKFEDRKRMVFTKMKMSVLVFYFLFRQNEHTYK